MRDGTLAGKGFPRSGHRDGLVFGAEAVRKMTHYSDRSCICPKHEVYFGQMTLRGPSLDARSAILDRIGATPAGVWTPVDFLDLGPRAAIDKALQRLAVAGKLRRIDRGLYDTPRLNRLTGRSTAPDTRAVLEAIARRDQARFIVDGLTAANDLGLTTAVPARVMVFTDNRLRPIKLGNQMIAFKQAAPSRLYWAGRPAMRVVQALYWLKDLLPSDRDGIMLRLKRILSGPDSGSAIRDDLRNGLPAMPIWMQSLVRELLTAPLTDDKSDDRRANHPVVVNAAKRSPRSDKTRSRTGLRVSRAGRP